MRNQKRRQGPLTKAERRSLGVSGLVISTYTPEGRATVQELVPESKPLPPFTAGFTHNREVGEVTEHNEEGGRRAEEMYAESVRRFHEREREQLRWEWVRYFDLMAANHAKLSQDYERRAAKLMQHEPEGETA